MRRPDLQIGGPADPYMRRWYVLPHNRFFNIYLHQIVRDDDDRALHDHPWLNLSIVLSGGYRELLFAWHPATGGRLPPLISKDRRLWRPIFRRAKTAHRLVLHRKDGEPVPAWSLFITGPRVRDWGFHCPGGRWVPWQEFSAGEHGELVGRGCE